MHALWKRSLVVTLVGALMGVVPAPPPAAAEPVIPEGFADHKVVMGAKDPANPEGVDRFEYHAYYPSRLRVHQGDVVWFEDPGGFHSVTFWPNGERQPRAFLPDEVPGPAVLVDMFNQSPSEFPTGPSCALGAQVNELEPCTYSGLQEYVSTGLPAAAPSSGRIRFDAEPGVYAYYCLAHRDMRGEIEIVPDDVPVASPEEVENARQVQITQDTETAEAMAADLDATALEETEVLEGGARRWTVYAGASTDDGRVGSLRFHPASLDVAPGDEVVIKAGPTSGDHLESHSATFIDRQVALKAGALLYMENLNCDPDGHSSGAPGVGMPTSVVTGCPEGWAQEFKWNLIAYREPVRTPGNAVVSPQQVHDSGLLFAANDDCDLGDRCDPWTGEPIGEELEARFPVEGDFEFFCLFHPNRGMQGSVTVRGPN